MQLPPPRVHATVPVEGNPAIQSIRLRLPVGTADLSPAALWGALSPSITTAALTAAEPLKET